MKQYLKKITPLYLLYLYWLKLKRKLNDRLFIPGYETKRKTIIDLAKKYNCTDVFIETGTYMGDTVDYVKNEFAELFSIELSGELAEKARKRFQNNSKINIIQGDSTTKLPEILSAINSNCTFWLDGHYSSEFQLGDSYIVTGKGDKETPIAEELLHIASKPFQKHLILIDDARLFNGKNDYPQKNMLKEFVKNHFPNHLFQIKKDIIRILPKQ